MRGKLRSWVGAAVVMLAVTNWIYKRIPQRSADESQQPSRRRPHSKLLRLIPPLWAILLLTTYGLVLLGFKLLPPDESKLTQPSSQPILNIWVDRPGVHLMAVLDGELAMDYSPLSLSLYTNKVPGGFHWLITSSSGNAPTRILQEGASTWTDYATGVAVGQQDSYTQLEHAADLRSTLLSINSPLPTALVLVRQDVSNIAQIGSRIQVVLPGIELENFLNPPSIKSPTGKWYQPSGQAVVIAPDEIQNYQTDVVSPAFVSPELWQSPTWVFPYWLGTDPTQESAENQHLFFAGLLFGIAGSAIIGLVQDATSRYRSWREKADRANPSAPH